MEKPSTFVSDIINCGIYLFTPDIFQHIGTVFQKNQQDMLLWVEKDPLGDASAALSNLFLFSFTHFHPASLLHLSTLPLPPSLSSTILFCCSLPSDMPMRGKLEWEVLMLWLFYSQQYSVLLLACSVTLMLHICVVHSALDKAWEMGHSLGIVVWCVPWTHHVQSSEVGVRVVCLLWCAYWNNSLLVSLCKVDYVKNVVMVDLLFQYECRCRYHWFRLREKKKKRNYPSFNTLRCILNNPATNLD